MEAIPTHTQNGGAAEHAQTLDEFLQSVQARAFTIARFSTADAEAALDVVQDVMLAFVRRYRNHPGEQRRPLFYRTLNNRLIDWHRKRQRRSRWSWPWQRVEDLAADGPDRVVATAPAAQPDRQAQGGEFWQALERALRTLPLRQRQVFLLRAWEGLDVDSTAMVLGIGAGSVKTHYFRALAALREALEEHR